MQASFFSDRMERTQAEQIAHEPPISAPLSEGAALMLAAERGAVRSIKGWQMRGGDINAPLSHSGSTMTPLQTAAHAGYTLAVRTLLQCGADGDRTLGSGPGHEAHTPLQLATRAGHVDVVAALLESGANPGARDVFGQTPLHYGAAFGHADCCVALLRYGSDPLALDASGHAPAALAKAAGHAQLARKARVEAGGVIAAQTRLPLRVLFLACSALAGGRGHRCCCPAAAWPPSSASQTLSPACRGRRAAVPCSIATQKPRSR